jgi:hypothetical protein
MLTRQERERLVIDLYNQGKTIRDIAKELRMSFRDIGAILKKSEEKEEEKENEEKQLLLSPSTQAYRLFSKGKAPIEVAIALNLSEVETTKFYEEYWQLKQMHELRMAYDEIGDDIVHFLKLYKLSRSAHMSPEHVVNLLQTSNEYLPLLEHKYKRLKKELDSFESEQQKLQYLGNQVGILTQVLEKTRGEIKSLHKEKIRLETRIRDTRNDEGYKKIRHAAEEEVTNALSKRRDLLKLAVSSVIESIIREPDKYNFLVSSSFYNGGQHVASQHYIDVYRALILDDAEKVFELMVQDLTSRIINEAALTIHP